MDIDPRRRRLPFADWPAADQQQFCRLFAAGGVFDDVGAGVCWRPPTRRRHTGAYGGWLNELVCAGDNLFIDPAARLTPERVARYVERLRTQVRPTTLWCTSARWTPSRTRSGRSAIGAGFG